jgi:CRP/FNR family cyclic AMP-dependent transcriptional regulator
MPNLLDRCASLPRTVVPAGERLIHQGRKLGSLFVLVEGSVTLERDDVSIAMLSEPGSIFGEMSSLLDRPATASVRATADSTFLVAKDGAAYLAERPDVTLMVARALAMRLDAVSGYMAEVKRQFADQVGHLGIVDEVMTTLMHDKLPTVQPGSARMPELDY